ncbi:glutaredoxin family protein [Alteromonas ponticola]|uniref:Glutaredoxin family protein n=1 Tax=Alteromonas aquimaris TaxID=2998417 RepID=A0ABT3P6P6_9ALTE|nr:glutaredoxin family protein [Alteromonas aquimaris]MCW8108445.1 glutaredoxin family protein [Alteromonas aquimaris]
MLSVVLYTGPGCHLCEDAMALLAQINQPIDVKKVNIRNDAELYHLYGARIPVIKREDTHAELGWPFDNATLEQFLK